MFRFHRTVFYCFKITYSPYTLSNLSPFLLVPLLGYPLPPLHQVCERILDPPILAFRLYNTDTYIYVFPLALVLSVIKKKKHPQVHVTVTG